MERDSPFSWWEAALSDTHCGAGCALGDIGGEWLVWAAAWTIGSTGDLGPEYILDLPLAWIFGILFQYFAIAPLRGQVGELAPLGDAIKSDTLSVLSFEVGLFGWMALAHYVIWQPPLPIDSSSQWFMMQVAMTLGFLTSWPVNRWLLLKGVKEPMMVARHRHLTATQPWPAQAGAATQLRAGSLASLSYRATATTRIPREPKVAGTNIHRSLKLRRAALRLFHENGLVRTRGGATSGGVGIVSPQRSGPALARLLLAYRRRSWTGLAAA
jgi:hypothetical protein